MLRSAAPFRPLSDFRTRHGPPAKMFSVLTTGIVSDVITPFAGKTHQHQPHSEHLCLDQRAGAQRQTGWESRLGQVGWAQNYFLSLMEHVHIQMTIITRLCVPTMQVLADIRESLCWNGGKRHHDQRPGWLHPRLVQVRLSLCLCRLFCSFEHIFSDFLNRCQIKLTRCSLAVVSWTNITSTRPTSWTPSRATWIKL